MLKGIILCATAHVQVLVVVMAATVAIAEDDTVAKVTIMAVMVQGVAVDGAPDDLDGTR